MNSDEETDKYNRTKNKMKPKLDALHKEMAEFFRYCLIPEVTNIMVIIQPRAPSKQLLKEQHQEHLRRMGKSMVHFNNKVVYK